ncbi:hypothetical protein FPQ18DRAFT_88743 [Pyronema domesticum]|nr:hypothetical protein FPQ18DRAFT_88743 [Pyronema domesticum]
MIDSGRCSRKITADPAGLKLRFTIAAVGLLFQSDLMMGIYCPHGPMRARCTPLVLSLNKAGPRYILITFFFSPLYLSSPHVHRSSTATMDFFTRTFCCCFLKRSSASSSSSSTAEKSSQYTDKQPTIQKPPRTYKPNPFIAVHAQRGTQQNLAVPKKPSPAASIRKVFITQPKHEHVSSAFITIPLGMETKSSPTRAEFVPIVLAPEPEPEVHIGIGEIKGLDEELGSDFIPIVLTPEPESERRISEERARTPKTFSMMEEKWKGNTIQMPMI